MPTLKAMLSKSVPPDDRGISFLMVNDGEGIWVARGRETLKCRHFWDQ